ARLERWRVCVGLEGRRAGGAGGGARGAWRAALLSAGGARIEVYTQDPGEELAALAAQPPRGPITVHARALEAHDLGGAAIAVGAIENEAEAVAFAAAARAAGVPVNVLD